VISFTALDNAGRLTVYVMPSGGGEWIRISDDKYQADHPIWSPDGKTIYFVANLPKGFFNVWGRRFDPTNGKLIGDLFQVTSYENLSRMIWDDMTIVGLGISSDRIVLPIMEASGGIWMLEDVDR
jgi:Tol biopolymer transport system component